MKFNKILDIYLKIDNNAPIPLLVRIFMFIFPGIKKEINAISEQLDSLKETSAFEVPFDLSDEVMDRIYELETRYEHNVSSLKWLSVGGILFASVFLISFSESFEWLRQHFGGHLEIPLNIVLGLAITIYAVLYISSHMDDFKKLGNYYTKFINRF